MEKNMDEKIEAIKKKLQNSVEKVKELDQRSLLMEKELKEKNRNMKDQLMILECKLLDCTLRLRGIPELRGDE